jgi:D-arabinose 1-dehydrogenase-like Zn-dependent alcohol dehydrogenase
LAKKLGASHYINSQTQDPAVELNKLGGAKVVLATVTNGQAMQATQAGLAVNGTLLTLGAADPFLVSPIQLLMKDNSVKGWYSGTSIDSEDTLSFSALTGIRSMNEVYRLDQVNEAFEQMISGKARFRVVMTMER